MDSYVWEACLGDYWIRADQTRHRFPSTLPENVRLPALFRLVNSRNLFQSFINHRITSRQPGDTVSQAKILVYRYLGSDNEEDEDHDLTGEMDLPKRGDIIYRKERAWKVVAIYTSALNDPLPRFWIHLIDMSRPECVN